MGRSQLQGSRFVEDINEKFSATMTNVVRYRDYVPPPVEEEEEDSEEDNGAPAAGSGTGSRKEIVSDTTIQAGAGGEVPGRGYGMRGGPICPACPVIVAP